jgi:hypothetical protein
MSHRAPYLALLLGGEGLARGTSVGVDIGSEDPAAAREIFARALRLTARIQRVTPATTK